MTMKPPGVEVRLEVPRHAIAENNFRAVYKYSFKNIVLPKHT